MLPMQKESLQYCSW